MVLFLWGFFNVIKSRFYFHFSPSNKLQLWEELKILSKYYFKTAVQHTQLFFVAKVFHDQALILHFREELVS